MVRKYAYQEEIKILLSEVFRDGDLDDREWTIKYELLKQKTPLEEVSQLIEIMIDKGYSLEQACKSVKGMFLKAKMKKELNDV